MAKKQIQRLQSLKECSKELKEAVLACAREVHCTLGASLLENNV